MTRDEAGEMIRNRLRQGQGRGPILRALQAAGVAGAARLYSRVRVEWLQGNLPGALRAGAQRHFWIGGPLLGISSLVAFVAWTAFSLNREAEGAVRTGLAAMFAAAFAAAELVWAWSRLRLARRLEREGPP